MYGNSWCNLGNIVNSQISFELVCLILFKTETKSRFGRTTFKLLTYANSKMQIWSQIKESKQRIKQNFETFFKDQELIDSSIHLIGDEQALHQLINKKIIQPYLRKLTYNNLN